MWSRIGLATARRQLRVRVALIGRVTIRPPASSTNLVLQRGFTASRHRAATAAAAEGKTKSGSKGTKQSREPAKTKTKKAAAPKKGEESKKAKKAVAKKKKVPKKKVYTEEQKQALQIRQLKVVALVGEEPAKLPTTARGLFFHERLSASGSGPNPGLRELHQEFSALPASERERLRATVEKNKLANHAAEQSWVQSRTPADINNVNNARRRLNRLKAYKRPLPLLSDDRIPKRPVNGFNLFMSSRIANAMASGSFVGGPRGARENLAKIGAEWKALSDSERQPFLDNAVVDRARYAQELKEVLGREYTSSV